MPTLDWLHREAAFQTAARVPTRNRRWSRRSFVFVALAHQFERFERRMSEWRQGKRASRNRPVHRRMRVDFS